MPKIPKKNIKIIKKRIALPKLYPKAEEPNTKTISASQNFLEERVSDKGTLNLSPIKDKMIGSKISPITPKRPESQPSIFSQNRNRFVTNSSQNIKEPHNDI